MNQEFENHISKILGKYELGRIRDSCCGYGKSFYLEYDEKLGAYILKFYLLSTKDFNNVDIEVKECIKLSRYLFKEKTSKNNLEFIIYN